MKQVKYTPARLVLIVVVVGLVLLAAAYLPDKCSSGKPELLIPARGCLFRIESNETPASFVEVFVDNRLKIIIDDRVYWIRLEVD